MSETRGRVRRGVPMIQCVKEHPPEEKGPGHGRGFCDYQFQYWYNEDGPGVSFEDSKEAWFTYDGDSDDPVMSPDEARRFVALWNAAHELGLTTEAIESGVLREAVEALRSAERVMGPQLAPATEQEAKLFLAQAEAAWRSVRSVLSKLGNR